MLMYFILLDRANYVHEETGFGASQSSRSYKFSPLIKNFILSGSSCRHTPLKNSNDCREEERVNVERAGLNQSNKRQ